MRFPVKSLKARSLSSIASLKSLISAGKLPSKYIFIEIRFSNFDLSDKKSLVPFANV